MEFSNNILQEIENDSRALLEELKLYVEAQQMNSNQNVQKQQNVNAQQNNVQQNPNAQQQPNNQTMDKPNNGNNEHRKKVIVKKSNALLDKIRKNLKNQDYLLNGFSYHSQILYKLCTKFPLLGKTIGVPLVAITKFAVNHLPPLANAEREKILDFYTKMKSDKIAVDEKISRLEKLQKPNNSQKDELIMLKKMSSELGMNLKRLEFNYKLSHVEEKKAKKDFQGNNNNHRKPVF